MDAFENHVLKHAFDTDGDAPVAIHKGFYLVRPGYGRMESVLILGTPEGVVICGDAAPGRGLVSDYGYSLEWFAGASSEEYLSSKFLTRRYVPEIALEIVQEWEAESEDHDIQAAARELLDAVKDVGIDETLLSNQADFCRWWVDHVDSCYEGEGMGYDPHEVAQLNSIQRAFSRGWRQLHGSATAGARKEEV